MENKKIEPLSHRWAIILNTQATGIWEQRRTWQPALLFLPGEAHGQRSLAGYSPWGCRRVGHDSATKQQ